MGQHDDPVHRSGGLFQHAPDGARISGKDLDVKDVDFLFVDGFHEEEHVLAEMEHFLPRLTENAVVVFHDCGGDNVQVGVNAAIKKLGLETAFLPTTNTMRIYGKFKP